MMKFQARQVRWSGWGAQLVLAAPLWACGAPAPEDSAADEEQPMQPAAARTSPAAPSAISGHGGAGAQSGAAPALGPAASDAVAALADQVGNVCGVALDRCTATEGCQEIVACAAEHACTGATCYCGDARCELPGPCRSVIDGAPGAAGGAAPGANRGPAADAAAALGTCVEQLFAAMPGASGAR